MNCELLIANGTNLVPVSALDGASIEYSRKGVPGKLSFTVLKSQLSKVEEGNPVSLKIDGTNMFYGFIFTRQWNKDDTVKVTAYDQLRYLKNKDTYIYTDKSASELIKMIADDYRLSVGDIADTGYKLINRCETDKTLFDIILTALDITLQNTGKIYTFYDDYGKLALKQPEVMMLNLLIDESSGENYDYTVSIDKETYNRVKLVYTTPAGKREVYIAQDGSNINKWGVLQYFESIDDTTNAKNKADMLLGYYNKPTKQLTFKGVFGDTRVRAGSGLMVKLNDFIGEIMIAERVKHTFSLDEHRMDLTLIGGDVSG